MSSRHDYGRSERERAGYRGGRRSRSRSPPRRGERDRRAPDRTDYYARDRGEDRRDRRDDRRDDRRRDDRDRRDYDRDGRRDPPPPPRGDADRDRDRSKHDRDRDRDGRPADRASEHDSKAPLAAQRDKQQTPTGTPDHEPSASRPREDSEVPTEDVEEGEAMDASNEDDAAMMAIMGLTGFGTTKGKHVDGNQEGGVDVKKQRTWRQYMNRRGGFNRPLDKIK
ncbi:DUF1777-domain-containing protein [Polyporus arcularius HHB13444]|uniref:DUF1777-domain-containing protein n=1 Tax=Polyporus arcularius HHB13444 TaxID=1314778 RepID=A0A5C3PQQ7_9APHY|nr:DUF1777-domain-containing protein [Polyporus arcularius HHB13444]